jgi:heme-degrading monooxygenase HmoA
MSVIVIVKFPGAHADTFREVYGRHAEMMKAISAEGHSKGAIHHQFVEDENGDVMVIDEWGTLEEFQGFFGAQDDIKKIVGELGLTGQPDVVSYQVLDTPDRF